MALAWLQLKSWAMKKRIQQFAGFEEKTALETLAFLRSHPVQCISEQCRCILQFACRQIPNLSGEIVEDAFGITEAKLQL
jgi:hypothetical protein